MLISMTTYICVDRPHIAVQKAVWQAMSQTADVDVLLGTWADVLPAICQLNALVRQIRPRESLSSRKKMILQIEDSLLDDKCEEAIEDIYLLNFGTLEDARRSPSRSPHSECLEVSPFDFTSHRQFSDCASADFHWSDYLTQCSPEVDQVKDESPPSSPAPESVESWTMHCGLMAHAYRLAALIQLYHTYPYVLVERLRVLPESLTSTPAMFIHSLSTYIVSLLQTIPLHSRLFNVCSFPLITAAQFCTGEGQRSWALSVVKYLQLKNGIEVVLLLARTLKEVWERRDGGEDVVWTTIFKEKGCEMMIN